MSLFAWTVVASTVVAFICLSLAWTFPRQLRTLLKVEVARVPSRANFSDRLRAVRRAAPNGSWEAVLVADLFSAESDQQRVVVVNEAMFSLEHELGKRQLRPLTAYWITAFSTVLVMGAGAIGGVRAELVALVPIGLAAMIGCRLAGRVGRRLAGEQRRRIDAFVKALLGDLYEADVAMPCRRRRRRRA